jgi:hypothetical protein
MFGNISFYVMIWYAGRTGGMALVPATPGHGGAYKEIFLDINPSNLPWPIRGGFENVSASGRGSTDGDAP